MTSNILHMRMTAPSGTINLNHSIPSQNMVLKSVRLQFVDLASETANPVLYVDLSSLFGPSQINNSSSNNSYLPVFTNSSDPTMTTFTTLYSPDMTIGLQKIVPESFVYGIYKSSGVLVTSGELTSLDLVFQYNKGGIV